MLNKEDILKAADIKTQEVEVPEWGGIVLVTMFSGAARNDLNVRLATIEKETGQPPTLTQVKMEVVALALIDEAGNRLFTDVKELATKSVSALDKVYAVAAKLNAVNEEAAKEAEKN